MLLIFNIYGGSLQCQYVPRLEGLQNGRIYVVFFVSFSFCLYKRESGEGTTVYRYYDIGDVTIN